jgi:hypothetical protein
MAELQQPNRNINNPLINVQEDYGNQVTTLENADFNNLIDDPGYIPNDDTDQMDNLMAGNASPNHAY